MTQVPYTWPLLKQKQQETWNKRIACVFMSTGRKRNILLQQV
jgi:hypothetical protein